MSLNKQIESLCQSITQEKDADKLLSLVEQLNGELAKTTETSTNARSEISKGLSQKADKKTDAA